MAYTTIDDPSAYFQTALYTGTGSGFSVTNSGNSNLQPDWVWVKDRDASNDHKITDSSRLASGKPSITLESNTAVAEFDDADPMSTDSFDTDGFTIGTNGNYNTDGNTYVAWQWKCNGGTTASVSVGTNDGNTTTACVRQVNTTAGFAIITYTADSNGEQFLEHGLGVAPTFLLVKDRGNEESWIVGHEGNLGTTAFHNYLELNTNTSSQTENRWLNTAPTSTAINIGPNNSVGGNGRNYVCYAFAPIQGYSKFGKYTGNGLADGPYIHTGFKPAWVMVKKSSADHSWYMQYGSTNIDSGDQGSNPVKNSLQANSNSADASENSMDFLSNGFKLRTTGNGHNTDTGTYIYMAFAEKPFVSSEGVPATAR